LVDKLAKPEPPWRIETLSRQYRVLVGIGSKLPISAVG
jgi:hypothetical protein